MNTEEIIKALRDMAKYPTVTLPRDSEALKAAADLLAQPEQEPVKDWVASHKEICALLRQAHDALALTSYPPQRKWVGLTDEEIDQGLLRTPYAMKTAEAWREGVRWAYHQLKEKNT